MDTNDNEQKLKAGWRNIARFTLYYWRRSAALYILTALLMLAAVSLDAFAPVYLARIVDAMVTGGRGAEGAAWAAFSAFIALAVSHEALRVSALYIWVRVAGRSLHAIVNDGMRKVQRFSADWHANAFAGATVRKITRGMHAFDSFEDTLLMGILPAVTIMVAVTAMLFVQLPAVGFVALGLILFYVGFSIWTSVRLLAPLFAASAAEDTRMGATLADIMTGNPTVKSFAAEKREEAVFLSVADAWRGKSVHAWNAGVTADAARSLIRAAMTAAMIASVILLWRSGKATPGHITLVISTFMVIGGYLRDIGRQISNLQRAVGDMDDAVSFWLRDEEVADAPGAAALAAAGGGSLAFEGVGFHYPAGGRWIYRALSVTVRAGENVALVGASGSGKSTFVKLAQRLYNVQEGRILLDGQDIAGVTLESLRRSIALVPQDPVLFHRSLSENIAYGRPGASTTEIEAAAKKARAHDFIMALPQGYATLVGERGVKLSGGERQRVAVARAILADAPVLVLDEATSSLDSVSEREIQKALDALTAGRTTITIAHRLSTVRKADRILVFENGAIIEQGTHDELVSHPSRYRELYETQALELTA